MLDARRTQPLMHSFERGKRRTSRRPAKG